MFDLIIVGGGPAGAAAAVYAARKRLKTVLITDEWGGQSAVSSDIQNWIGTPAISGQELAKNLRKHVEASARDSLSMVFPARAVSLVPEQEKVILSASNGNKYEASAVLIAAGATRRKLQIPGAKEYDQKGLTYCATCDGPLFADKDVAVIGGGNAAFETAAQLLAYCKTVTLVNRGESFRADEITIHAVLAHPNARVLKNAVLTEVIGDKFVTGLRWRNQNGEEKTLDVEGIFVEIGLIPNTEWLKDPLVLNQIGQIIVDPRTGRASLNDTKMHSRIWAAGDCTDGKYHQNNIAAGDAVKALEDVYLFIKSS